MNPRVIADVTLKCITLSGKAIRAGTTYTALMVSDTDGLFAVDERFPAVLPEQCDEGDGCEAQWAIIHVPTMCRIDDYELCHGLTTQVQAIAAAQAFYREAKARGWTLDSEDTSEITRPHNAMSDGDKIEFWNAVGGRTV
ncbi:MAG: hypothetical protein ACRESS_12390 [Stenotrophobium sp.]